MNDDFYTIKTLAEELGFSKSQQAKLRATKDIPFNKVGKKIFYDKHEINKWIKGQ